MDVRLTPPGRPRHPNGRAGQDPGARSVRRWADGVRDGQKGPLREKGPFA
ncbi:hypothetical protein AB0H69_04450 [Streptomyces phaeochromogenes]